MLPDPNVALRIILSVAEDIVEAHQKGHDADQDAVRMAEILLALDHWIAGGGSLPDRWRPKADRPINPSPSTN